MSDLNFGFPTTPSPGHAAGMANAGPVAKSHRFHTAENRAELKAMRSSRFAGLRRLLNRLSRGGQ